MSAQRNLKSDEYTCPASPVCGLIGILGFPCQAYPPSAKSISKPRSGMQRLTLIQADVEQMLYCHQSTVLLLGEICRHLGIELGSTQPKA